MHVEEAELDDYSGSPWYKIIVNIPQLHLESPLLNTADIAEEMVEEIAVLSDYCPHCKKRM